MVRFESALERDCITRLASLPGFRRIVGQPLSVTLVHGGCRRRYTPDFLATFDPVPAVLGAIGFDVETYVEVKYADQAATERELIDARLAAVAIATGSPAVLLDETFIRGAPPRGEA